MRMAFIIIETKEPIQSYKKCTQILSRSYSIVVAEETHMLIIQSNHDDFIDKDLFLGLSSELYADLRVYVSASEPKFSVQVIETWFKNDTF